MATNPSNIVRLHSRNGGRASVYEANMWAQVFSQGLLSGNGVLQNTSPDMNVLVGGSPTNPDVVIGQNASGYKIALDIVGQQAILVTAPASNARVASIVAYTDDLSLASTETTTTGNPAKCGLIVVYGTTAASPTAASDSTIRTAITADGATGSQAAYAVIANITVQSTTTTITNALIIMGRAQIGAVTLSSSAITLGYAQTTNSFSSTSSAGTQIPGLTVTVTIPVGSRRVKITAFAADGYSSGSAGYMGISIWDGAVGSGTQLSRAQMNATNTTGQAPLVAIAVPPVPAAGTKTYNVGLYTNSGTANIECGATFPAFILVEAI